MDTKRKPITGSLKISQDVLATIARVAALEVEGVANLAEDSGSVKRMFSRNGAKMPIRIEQNDDFAKVDITINLKMGAKIHQVCSQVQANVKDNIQTMTGMAVSKVNVTVAGIVFPEEPVRVGE